MLVDHQARRLEGYPYVFVPPARYDYIQNLLRPKTKLRPEGRWTLSDSRLKVVNNFKRSFDKILRRAGIKTGTFHDVRRTAISSWFVNGMSEHDVMVLAGHSNFATTHEFYLAVADDLVDRARQASKEAMKSISVAKLLQVSFEAENKKVLPTQVLDSTRLISVRAGSSVGRATD